MKNNHEVNLIAVTKPVDTNLTSQDLIAFMARVSNPANQDNKQTAGKLLKYLVKNNHWSPFEMINVVIEIKCTRTIGRQILRHRSFTFQEFSQRYAKVSDEMFTNDYIEARMQDPVNRQNSIKLNSEEYGSDWTIKDQWEIIQGDIIAYAKTAYANALQLGIAKELARVVLPEGLTMSHMYMSGSLRSWYHYCSLRMGNGTQFEHQEIANACWQILIKEFPALNEVL